MDKSCNTCIMYRRPAPGYTCGACAYPAPEWIVNGCSGGNFIGNPPDNYGLRCATYKCVVDPEKDD